MVGMDKRKKISLALFALFSLIFFIVNVATIKDGHNWGGDFSQYIRHARNIVEHKPYASGIMLDQWVVVPPGFSLLLAPLVKCFGVNFKIFKLLNVVVWQGFAVVLFFLMRRYSGRGTALWGAAVFLSSVWFFLFKQNVLSDVPFLFFVTLAVWLMDVYTEPPQNKKGAARRGLAGAILLVMAFAFLTRWAGMALFVAAALHFLIVKREKRFLLVMIVILAFTLAVQKFLGVSAESHLREIRMPLPEFFLLSYQYIPDVALAVAAFFVLPGTIFSDPLYAFLAPLLKVLSPFLVLGLVVFFIVRIVRRSISFLAIFFCVYLLGMILWPIPGAEGRYILPILGPLVILGIKHCERFYQNQICRRWGASAPNQNFFLRLIFILMILHNAVMIFAYYDFDDNKIYLPANREMAEWVRENLKPEERFMFNEPRVLGLLTDRMGTTFWIYPEDKERWDEKIEPLGIDYLIFAKEHHGEWIEQVRLGRVAARLVWENQAYAIFKIIPG